MKASNSSIAKTLVLIALLTVALCQEGHDHGNHGNHGNHGTTQPKKDPVSSTATATSKIISLIAYNFDVYCPINSKARLAKINQFLGLKKNMININFRKNRNFYIVIARAKPLDPKIKESPAGLFYCGLARKPRESDCDKAEVVCSIPGPMFRFQRKEKATIMWINDVYSQKVNWVSAECYNPATDNHFCTIAKKINADSCTYFQPTEYLYKTQNHRITKSAVPLSPHIHGLEVRPTFDGNPLGWYTTAGDKGPGFNTLNNQKYYALFDNPIYLKGLLFLDPQISKRTKIIEVPNDQNPGFLFYHDHSMRATRYNVMNGLSGLYIIEDKKAEAKLPKGLNQKIIVLNKVGDARVLFGSQSDVTDKGDSLNSKLYRLRLLSGHFAATFSRLSFSVYYKTQKKSDGSTLYKELDPTSSADFNLTADQHKISFSVIGTDTSLFSDPVDGVEQVTLAPAERVDLLINFRKNLPAGIKYVYIVCFDNFAAKVVVKHRFSLAQDDKTGSYLPSWKHKQSHHRIVRYQDSESSDCSQPEDNKKMRLKVPFVDLSTVADKEVAVKRHRPLWSLPDNRNFVIGAHFMFDDGASQNPKIGTIEDFYIVNTQPRPHPMHVHLVNFQIVRAYSLKKLPQNQRCTLYLLDFLRMSGLPQFQKKNVDLCTYILSISQKDAHQILHKLDHHMREDIIGADRNSGLNSLAPYDNNADYLVEGCQFNTVYKYVCADTTKDIEPYLRRYKDTTLVPATTVYVFRMRWASNSYDPKVRSYPYFGVPEDQLVEFPGFVHHCHTLPHQDNEMMRPIMVRLSDRYVREHKKWRSRCSCSRPTWLQSLKCINKKGGCLV